MNRDQFLDYIFEHSEKKGNKLIIKVGDICRLGDKLFGELKPEKTTETVVILRDYPRDNPIAPYDIFKNYC